MFKKLIPNPKPKVLAILGTTSSGKTALGVRLAVLFDGEIVSADSRQVYRGLDIGTGKDLAEYQVGSKRIPAHLLDVASPKTRFDLARYQKLAFKAIEDILRRGHLPILVGGSGLYLQAVVDNYRLTSIRPDAKQRREWEKLSAPELLEKISRFNPGFAARLNNSDKHNARRLVRYLEIVAAGEEGTARRQESPYDFLILGLSCPDDVLRERITQRLLVRLEKEGLVAEVHRLNKEGVSWKRLQSFGLEYKFVSQHLLGKLSYSEMIEKLSAATYQFARRQKSWFRRFENQGAKISWIKDQKEAEAKVKKWL